jgi:hypothetical protein
MSKVKVQEETAAETAQVTVDYPREGERITGTAYTFRVESKAPGSVEISVDQNEWKACRQAGGYWWYDWADYKPGAHRAVARIHPQNGGKRHISHAVSFNVDL